MTEPFVGEIRIFAGNFAPRGWAFCDGQLLAVSQNEALFSLVGTIYGGDGRTTYGIPDLRGRTPMHRGQGPGLSNRKQGAALGTERVTLVESQMPSHTHSFGASTDAATQTSPGGNVFAAGSTEAHFYIPAPENPKSLMGAPVGNTGGSQSHNNLMPALCLNFIISLFGTYPSRD